MKNHVKVCRMSWIMEWYYIHLLLRFIWAVENNSVNGSIWSLVDPSWWTEVSGMYPLICWCMPLQRQKCYCVLNGYQLYTCGGSGVWSNYCPSKQVYQTVFRDSATGPNISLTTDHICLLCSLDFGCVQWSRWKELLLTVPIASVNFPSM